MELLFPTKCQKADAAYLVTESGQPCKLGFVTSQLILMQSVQDREVLEASRDTHIAVQHLVIQYNKIALNPQHLQVQNHSQVYTSMNGVDEAAHAVVKFKQHV